MTAQCAMQFSSRGVRPGVTTVLARHLDKNTMGYLQWRWGAQSSMNTSIVRDTKSSHFTFAVQVSNMLKPGINKLLRSGSTNKAQFKIYPFPQVSAVQYGSANLPAYCWYTVWIWLPFLLRYNTSGAINSADHWLIKLNCHRLDLIKSVS